MSRAAVLAFLLLVPAAAPLAGAQDEADLYRAYYLEHETSDEAGALELYRRCAANRELPSELRRHARRRAAALAEDLAAADLTRLMPAETIVYVELGRPGDQVASLLDQLGLLNEGEVQADSFGVRPELVHGLLGLRGAALAITGFNPIAQKPDGVLVLHAGKLDAVRGLFETALPAQGQAIEPIAGHPAWRVENEAYVALTRRLVIAGTRRSLVEGVALRLAGEEGSSLATTPAAHAALAGRGEGLLSFCARAEPIRPLLKLALQQQTRRDPELATAIAMLDIDHLEGLSGGLRVAPDGLELDLALALREGHQNLFFNLLRMPAVRPSALDLVPDGAAFFALTSLNAERPAAPPAGNPAVVSWMDFGREIFANVADVAIFGLPPASGSEPGVPAVALALRVHEPERSLALWRLVLGLASQSIGDQGAPHRAQIAGVDVEEFEIEGQPVFLAVAGHDLLVSPSRSAIERTLAARQAGATVARDAAFDAKHVAFDGEPTFLVAAAIGRCMALAAPLMPPRDRREIEPFAELLSNTVASLRVDHSAARLGLRARATSLPDVSPLVVQMLRAAHTGTVAVQEAGTGTGGRNQPEGVEVLRTTFENAAARAPGDPTALAFGEELLEAKKDDPNYLNDLAWKLLTGKHYDNGYDGLALRISQRCNELTDHENWMYIDTLALAHFRCGEVERAVELQERAVSLAEGDPRRAEAVQAYERYLAALGRDHGAGDSLH